MSSRFLLFTAENRLVSLLYRMFRFYARGKTAKFFTLFLAGLAAGGADVIYRMQHTAAVRYIPYQHHRRRGRARPARSLAEGTRPRGKCVGISRKSCGGEPADACGSLKLPGRIWNPPLRCRGRCLHRPGGLTAARLLRANHVRPRLSKNSCRGEHCSPVPVCLARKLSRKMRCCGKLAGDQWSPLHTQ